MTTHDPEMPTGGSTSEPASHFSAKDCSEVLGRVFFFLDNELDQADCAEIQHHLDECGPCLARYDLERTVKTLVARSCTEVAPEGLRQRVMLSIRQVQVEIPGTTDRPGLGPIRLVAAYLRGCTPARGQMSRSERRRRTTWARPAASAALARRRARTTASAPTPERSGHAALEPRTTRSGALARPGRMFGWAAWNSRRWLTEGHEMIARTTQEHAATLGPRYGAAVGPRPGRRPRSCGPSRTTSPPPPRRSSARGTAR